MTHRSQLTFPQIPLLSAGHLMKIPKTIGHFYETDVHSIEVLPNKFVCKV